MSTNDREKFILLKWLSKDIVAINWFSDGVSSCIIAAEHINECKCIAYIINPYFHHECYCIYHKTAEHDLKSE